MQGYRLLISSTSDPYENMALDETLLTGCEMGISPPTLRFYSWHPYAITIGYSQRIDGFLNIGALKGTGIPLVRRPTGGGMLCHYNDISYAIIYKRRGADPSEPFRIYKEINRLFVELLRLNGIDAYLEERKFYNRGCYICYSTPSRFEVMVDGKKVIGSAQRRLRNAFLQHGSIFLYPPPDLLKGVLSDPYKDLRALWLGEHIDIATIRSILRGFVDSFASTFDIDIYTSGLLPFEKEYLIKLCKEKYNRDAWNIDGVSDLCHQDLVAV